MKPHYYYHFNDITSLSFAFLKLTNYIFYNYKYKKAIKKKFYTLDMLL